MDDYTIKHRQSLSPDSTPELNLIIRFSASIPDVQLGITSPSTTTVAGVKQLIRGHLPPDLANRRIRLICSGRGLEDTSPLTTSLKLPPSSRTSKAILRDAIPDDIPRVYVHCSIGDIVLSASDLSAEAAMASTFLLQQQQHDSTAATTTTHQERNEEQEADDMATTTPAPRGFDRLLSAGFTPGEVAALRSQFLALQSISHTPDTMPTGAELRELEDRWMDEGSGADGAGVGITFGGGGGTGGDEGGGFGSSSNSALDDMLWGAVMGFFWPIGCAMWLRREEGVWSWRKGLAVFVGVVVNVAFGAVRVMN
ncbi:conserved membrane protein, putative [Talaromyces stipitatus ATCC 10500]|uniref:Conserved membrane protein, putative n=1 Tax=Talaromyces stipitatus (strain ATCC 10500 / CBS 375.48 / QM 6759 / NRRL 1006) TaxID=441959 RepID=B8LWP7_TALSN|nr:conserved membrane protein, putative [Talaromyces stipitatus ATCC 10500]EED24444.1 conserved membrane protein, putative [Talaromyces stipitatus ATCC 10500]